MTNKTEYIPLQNKWINLFVKNKPQTEREEEIIQKELLESVEKAKKELNIAHNNFNNADSSELANVCIYQIMAAQEKYQFLIKKVKDCESIYEKFN